MRWVGLLAREVIYEDTYCAVECLDLITLIFILSSSIWSWRASHYCRFIPENSFPKILCPKPFITLINTHSGHQSAALPLPPPEHPASDTWDEDYSARSIPVPESRTKDRDTFPSACHYSYHVSHFIFFHGSILLTSHRQRNTQLCSCTVQFEGSWKAYPRPP